VFCVHVTIFGKTGNTKDYVQIIIIIIIIIKKIKNKKNKKIIIIIMSTFCKAHFKRS